MTTNIVETQVIAPQQFPGRSPSLYLFIVFNSILAIFNNSEEEVIREGIAAFRLFLQSIGVPSTLSQMQIREEQLSAIQEDVIKISFNAQGVLHCNPPVTAADIAEILKLAM
ncbi:hypothetical protein LJC35_01435 [Parabacteroides sp. OttesenSCG-928-N08]|nr:hypothetical protein [Parabacteroides sp. OttesenSCG-928-N08]